MKSAGLKIFERFRNNAVILLRVLLLGGHPIEIKKELIDSDIFQDLLDGVKHRQQTKAISGLVNYRPLELNRKKRNE